MKQNASFKCHVQKTNPFLEKFTKKCKKKLWPKTDVIIVPSGLCTVAQTSSTTYLYTVSKKDNPFFWQEVVTVT